MSKVTKDDKGKKGIVEETFPEETGSGKFIYPNGAIYIGEYKQLSTGEKVREGKGKMIHPLIDARLNPSLNPPKSEILSKKDSKNEEEEELEEEEKKEEKKEEEKKEEEIKEKGPYKTNIDLLKELPLGTSGMKENGKMIKWKDMVYIIIQMVIYMKEIGLIINIMVMEHINLLMVIDMKVNGKNIKCLVLVNI